MAAAPRGTRQQRGYDAAHDRKRAIVKRKVEAGDAHCARCGGWIAPGSEWHLDHDDHDRSKYVGPSHARCNVSAARTRAKSRKGVTLAASATTPTEFPEVAGMRRVSRDWFGDAVQIDGHRYRRLSEL